MRAPTKLGLYGAALAAVFAVTFVAAGTVVPEDAVHNWAEHTDDHSGDDPINAGGHPEDHEVTGATGLALEADGYRLTGVTAPAEPGEQGHLTLAVEGADGQPVTDFALSHEKELHLIVVRTDGTYFEHVHPERDPDGTWSIPWQWEDAGSYRIYADFVPAATGEDITLSTIVNVPGEFTPEHKDGSVVTDETGGYQASIEGGLTPGEASRLTVTITRDGEPVTTLEPYLGAYGHLVALRDGDLAYLHVHPHGEEPRTGETSGPQVLFEVTAPTTGRYLLYLDFQVDGEVHTAELVLDTGTDGPSPQSDEDHEEGRDHDHGE